MKHERCMVDSSRIIPFALLVCCLGTLIEVPHECYYDLLICMLSFLGKRTWRLLPEGNHICTQRVFPLRRGFFCLCT